MEKFITQDQSLTEDQVNKLTQITKSDVDKAINTAPSQVKQYLIADEYKRIDKNYSLGGS
jgi:hypothetical protein